MYLIKSVTYPSMLCGMYLGSLTYSLAFLLCSFRKKWAGKSAIINIAKVS